MKCLWYSLLQSLFLGAFINVNAALRSPFDCCVYYLDRTISFFVCTWICGYDITRSITVLHDLFTNCVIGFAESMHMNFPRKCVRRHMQEMSAVKRGCSYIHLYFQTSNCTSASR